MDPRFRFDDATEVLESLADDIQARVRTAIPVMLTEDSDGHTVKLQPLTMLTRRKADGTLEKLSLPVLSDVPINHHGGGGITVTHPHKKGDEGIILIADRAIDAWHQNGGQQGAVDARMHSLSDGFYIPGVRSTPRKLENVSTTSTQMRSDDGKHLYDLHPTEGAKVSIENAKHVMSFHPSKGIAASVDGGKHVLNLDPATGISMKTAMALALTATQGMALTGNLNVTGNIGASGSIGAPSLQGLLSAFTGAAMAVLLMLGAQKMLAPPGAQSVAPQTASYLRAALDR